MKILNSKTLLLLAWICMATACENETAPPIDQESIPKAQYTEATGGIVSSSHPLATAAGRKILQQGGNAVDAAVATAFALAVVEPAMSGLGGRLQALVRTIDGELHGVDATTQAPMTYDPETAPQAGYGYPVIGVPGVVAGLSKLNLDLGSLPLATVMGPAIDYAEQGFHQLPDQVAFQNRVSKQLMEFEGSRRYFIRPGDTVAYNPEDLLIQKDLAHTLKLIAEKGPDVFYKGEIAQKIVEDMEEHGGAVTLESLANYEAKDAVVLSGRYRGYDVHGLWMPSFGAITIEILQILENLPMDTYSEVEWASAMYQAIKIAYEDRFKQTSLEVGEHLIDVDYAKEQAGRIHVGQPTEAGIEGLSGNEYFAWRGLGHTTHLSVVDKNGMVVSLTQSLGPIMGSRVATPGLGFLYAATLGGYLGPFQPGQRAASHISPTILTSNGQPFMGIGAAGGSRINSAIVQAISRVVDRKMDLFDALQAPRVHPSQEGVILEMHDSLAWHPEDLDFLRKNGFIIEQQKEPFRFGRVHAVMRKDTTWTGAADPDGEGATAGINRGNI